MEQAIKKWWIPIAVAVAIFLALAVFSGGDNARLVGVMTDTPPYVSIS